MDAGADLFMCAHMRCMQALCLAAAGLPRTSAATQYISHLLAKIAEEVSDDEAGCECTRMSSYCFHMHAVCMRDANAQMNGARQ
jgi:hypothetical protein